MVKAKIAAKRSTVKKSTTAEKKSGGLDLGKVQIGSLKLDDVFAGTSKNMQSIADANHAMVDGYVNIAKREFEMLKELLEELKQLGGSRSELAKELRNLVEHARKDVQTLRKMAKKTNAAAQKIVKKRSNANLKAWDKLAADAKKSLGIKDPKRKNPPTRKPAAKKAVAKKKPAEAKQSTTRKKAASKT